MSVRLDAAGDYLARTANLPSNTAFTLLGWSRVVTDQGSGTIQPLFLAANASFTDAIALYWDQSTSAGNMRIGCAVGGVETSGTNFGSRPASATDFAWYIQCSGTGAGQLVGGWRNAGSSTWTTAAATLSGSIATITSWRIGNVAGIYYLNGRVWNVKCWDRVLSAAELDVESYHERVVYPSSRNWHWPLYNATTTRDISGNARDPTVGGTLASEGGSAGLWRFRNRIIVPAAAAATIEQEGYRWGNDDGAEGAHTWAAAADTNITAAGGEKRLLNFVVNVTGSPGAKTFKLQYRKVGDPGWTDMPLA